MQKNKPLYNRVYYINLSEVMQNPVHWSEHKELPICKIENDEEIKKTQTTNEPLPNKTIATIHCPSVHVKAIVTHNALFNEKRPCTVLEYQRQINSDIQTKTWMFRVFPDGGIDTNDPSLDNETFTDIQHQVEIRNRMFYPKNSKRK